jgi:flavodoxin
LTSIEISNVRRSSRSFAIPPVKIILNNDDRISALTIHDSSVHRVEFEEDLAEEVKAGFRRAIVIFDTRYGNTERIARALGTGLKSSGVETTCINVREVKMNSLKEYELIAIGAPTEWHSASKPMKAFLENLKNVDLNGKFGFAFDTRFEAPLSGSAAKGIEKELERCGLEMIAPRESALILGRQKSEKGNVKLKAREEERFEQVGYQAGLVLARKEKMIPA